jgi:hypothetical protein
LGGEVNPSEVSEQTVPVPTEDDHPRLSVMEAPSSVALSSSALSSSAVSPSPSSPVWLRLAYALEFLLALIAIVTMWGEIGGEAHLDLMPWYVKLGCILGLAWCSVRFTAGLVESPGAWSGRTIGWFIGILMFCLLMGGITYYYHLHEEPDNGDDDSTANSVNINQLGTFFYHGSERNRFSFQICFLERSPVRAGDRISVGSDGRDPRLRV